MKLLIILICLLVYSPAWAAQPTFDARTVATCTSCAGQSFAHTIGGACTNRIVVVDNAVAFNALSTVTVAGNTATAIATRDTDSNANKTLDMRQVVGLTTGSNTVAVTYGSADGVDTTSARSYCGVDQTTSTGTGVTNGSGDGGSTTPSVTVLSAVNELVIDGVMAGVGSFTTITVDGSQAQRTNDITWNEFYFVLGESDEAGGASVSMDWTVSENVTWAAIGVALKPVAAGAAVTRRRVIVVE